MSTRYASVADLPGYRTPATVAEIPAFPNSFGFVCVPSGIFLSLVTPGIAQDEDGKLWANPKTYLMSSRPDNDVPWAAVAWTEEGLGVFVPQHTYSALARSKRSASFIEGWVPVVEVLDSVPGAADADA